MNDQTQVPAFAVLLNGTLHQNPHVADALRGTRVIAADGGIRHAKSLGLVPELWVGDFDSTPPEQRTAHEAVPRETHPAAKNATDGELAIRAALARGAKRIVLVGAFGGDRLDHALGTIMLAASLASEARFTLLDGAQWGWPLIAGTSLRIRADPGAPLSIVALSDLKSLSIDGAEWPLDARDVPFGSSLTLSNAVGNGSRVRVELAHGKALAVLTAPRAEAQWAV